MTIHMVAMCVWWWQIASVVTNLASMLTSPKTEDRIVRFLSAAIAGLTAFVIWRLA
jgi:hypothetical protein